MRLPAKAATEPSITSTEITETAFASLPENDFAPQIPFYAKPDEISAVIPRLPVKATLKRSPPPRDGRRARHPLEETRAYQTAGKVAPGWYDMGTSTTLPIFHPER